MSETPDSHDPQAAIETVAEIQPEAADLLTLRRNLLVAKRDELEEGRAILQKDLSTADAREQFNQLTKERNKVNLAIANIDNPPEAGKNFLDDTFKPFWDAKVQPHVDKHVTPRIDKLKARFGKNGSADGVEQGGSGTSFSRNQAMLVLAGTSFVISALSGLLGHLAGVRSGRAQQYDIDERQTEALVESVKQHDAERDGVVASEFVDQTMREVGTVATDRKKGVVSEHGMGQIDKLVKARTTPRDFTKIMQERNGEVTPPAAQSKTR